MKSIFASLFVIALAFAAAHTHAASTAGIVELAESVLAGHGDDHHGDDHHGDEHEGDEHGDEDHGDDH